MESKGDSKQQWGGTEWGPSAWAQAGGEKMVLTPLRLLSCLQGRTWPRSAHLGGPRSAR